MCSDGETILPDIDIKVIYLMEKFSIFVLSLFRALSFRNSTVPESQNRLTASRQKISQAGIQAPLYFRQCNGTMNSQYMPSSIER